MPRNPTDRFPEQPTTAPPAGVGAGGEPAQPPPRPRRPGSLWFQSARRRQSSCAISPDRFDQIRERLLSGFYDTPDVRTHVARRVALVLSL